MFNDLKTIFFINITVRFLYCAISSSKYKVLSKLYDIIYSILYNNQDIDTAEKLEKII